MFVIQKLWQNIFLLCQQKLLSLCSFPATAVHWSPGHGAEHGEEGAGRAAHPEPLAPEPGGRGAPGQAIFGLP